MLTMNLRMAKRAIMSLYAVGRPVILMGSPGIGKTEIIRQAAKDLGIGCKITEASSLDPTDTRGIPYVVDGESRYGKPSLFPNVSTDGSKGLVGVDEIASCPPAVQVSLYPFYLEKRLGDYPLPEGWLPVGTGNYTSDGAVAYNLSTALTDRAFILNVEPNFEIWKEDFALPRGIHQDIISFLNWRPELFYTFDKRDKTAKGKAFASARSYELASDALKTDLDDETLAAVLTGCLGDGTASEFMAFRKVCQQLPDVKKIYLDKYDKVPTEANVLYALSGALVGYLSRLPESISKSTAIDRFIEYAMKMPAEFCVRTIKDAIIIHKQDLTKSKMWSSFSKQYIHLVV